MTWVNISRQQADIMAKIPELAPTYCEFVTQNDHLVSYAGVIATAREQTDDDLEIDDEPSLSIADEGCWVSAWIWVPNPDEDEENI